MSTLQQIGVHPNSAGEGFVRIDRGITDRWLPLYAKAVVLAIFTLLFVGGLVTSLGAGMAVPDWPLSFNSINPSGWWSHFPVRLEHGHRLIAIFVGLLVGGLCAWTWECWMALFAAILTSAVVPPLAAIFGASKPVIMHLAIWPAAATFVGLILFRSRGRRFVNSASVRWTTLSLYTCVCIQATLGGLRVTRETALAFDTAMVFRIAHGSFAQLFVLSLAVASAAMLSPVWNSLRPLPTGRRLARFAWLVYAVLVLQLIVGASMRHLGAGLAIPTFPKAAPDGSWIPPIHNAYVDLNFSHTRILALLVTVAIVALFARIFRAAAAERHLMRPAWAMLALVGIQVTLGILVIQIQTPPGQGAALRLLGNLVWVDGEIEALRLAVGFVKTVHVLNGAIILATSLLLALRLGRSSATGNSSMSQAI